MISLDSITKTYGKKDNAFTALDDINLKIKDGSSVAIVGKSGSGKSTLTHVMSGLDKATDGEVAYGDDKLSQMKPAKVDHFRAEEIGFIFQSFFVQANETCADNVSMALEIAGVKGKERREKIETALENVELIDKKDQKAKNLSGGQKQRLAIARAIVNEPRVIFADEPTGNLDSATSDVIEDLLFGLNKKLGCTLIIVTHDDELAAKCNRQIHLRDGKVVKDSTEHLGRKTRGKK